MRFKDTVNMEAKTIISVNLTNMNAKNNNYVMSQQLWMLKNSRY